jgi:1-acyl-sn-glycerol-3-phosphate acyltransferase
MKQGNFVYPRRRPLRWLLQKLSVPALALFARLQVIGQENMPAEGPLLVVANHFSFLDPVAFVRMARWPLEFIGGADFPHAPEAVKFIPKIWGYYPVYRGTGSRYALQAALEILRQKGVLAIFPEGGSWAEVLRPARPGTAWLAAESGARVLPVGLHGLNDVFPWKPGKRAQVTIRIGKPIGPFQVRGRGRERRRQLEAIGDEIMQHIAELLPAEKRGVYAEDPALRAAAWEVAAYPWDDRVEGQVEGEVH